MSSLAAEVLSYVRTHPRVIFPALIILGLGNAMIQRLRKRQRFPSLESVTVVFRESFASGNSMKSFLTRMGGASRCLRVIVTSEELWISTFFPCSIAIHQYDLEHRIPLDRILGAELQGRVVLVGFRRADGSSGQLRLFLRDPAGFLQAIRRGGPPPLRVA